MATTDPLFEISDCAGTLLEELRAAYRSDPTDLKTVSRLAEHYADRGWINESLDLYREALARNGDDYFLLLGYGNTCCRSRHSEEALEAFGKLTRLEPGRIEGWNNSGIVLLDLCRVDEAIAAFDKVLEIEPSNAGALINLGNCRARCDHHEEAARLFEQAIAISPDSADAWFNLGNSRLALGELEQARAAYERALNYKREFPSALKNLGFTLTRLGEHGQALERLSRAAELDPADAGIMVNMAGVYLEQDRIEEAKNCFLNAVRLQPVQVDAWRGLQRIAFMKGDLVTYTRCTIGILPRLDDEAAAASIELLIEQGHFDEARTIVSAADQGARSGPELDSQRLVVYGRPGGDPVRSADIYKRLCADPVPSDRILRALARHEFAQGKRESVVSRIEAMQTVEPAMQHLLVGALIALGRGERALAYLQQFSASDPTGSEFAILYAHLAIESGRRSEARAHLIQAIECGADFAELPSSPRLVSLLEDARPDAVGGSV